MCANCNYNDFLWGNEKMEDTYYLGTGAPGEGSAYTSNNIYKADSHVDRNTHTHTQTHTHTHTHTHTVVSATGQQCASCALNYLYRNNAHEGEKANRHTHSLTHTHTHTHSLTQTHMDTYIKNTSTDSPTPAPLHTHRHTDTHTHAHTHTPAVLKIRFLCF